MTDAADIPPLSSEEPKMEIHKPIWSGGDHECPLLAQSGHLIGS